MQSVSAAFTAEEKDKVRSIAASLLVSWKKETNLAGRTFTIGVSLIGGPDVIGINVGAIGGPGIYNYFDESEYLLSLAWERGLNMPIGGLSTALAEARIANPGEDDYGYSLAFNGSSTQITTSSNTWTTEMTFAGWVYREDASAAHAMLGSSGGSGLIIRFQSGTNEFRFWSDASGASASWTNAAVNAAGFALQTWTHWCVTFDSTTDTANLYINGALVGGSPVTYTVDFGSPGNLKIGARSAGSDFFKGKQDEIRIWTRVLTATEVYRLFQHRIIPPGLNQGYLREYLFDEGSGTVALETRSGFNGTIADGTYSTSTPGQVVRRTNGRFTPHYMGGESELFTSILPRRPFIINAGFEFGGIPQTIPQFAGILTRQPAVDDRRRMVRLVGADYTDFFSNRYLDQEVMFTGLRTDQVIEDLFQSLGMSTAQYELDPGINVIPFGLFDKGTRFSSILNDLVQAENGHAYQDEEGKFRFENRQHWDSSPHNTVSRIVLTGQVIDAEAPDEDHIINVVEIEAPIRVKQPLQTIFSLPPLSALEIPAGGSLEQFFEFEDPVLALTDPTYGGADSFFIANSTDTETGTNLSNSITVQNLGTFARAVKYRFINSSASTAFLTRLVLSGRVAKQVSDLYYRDSDSSSVTAYEERTLTINNPYIQNESWARSLTQMILNDFSEPENLQRITIRALPSLQLGDLISWQGRHWRVFKIEADLDSSAGFVQRLTLLQRDIVLYFRIGISTIGGSDQIAP